MIQATTLYEFKADLNIQELVIDQIYLPLNGYQKENTNIKMFRYWTVL